MPNPAQPLILIVDDDHTLQMMLKVAMEQEGFSVVQAGNGDQCLQDYQRLQPDMVLIDAMMPGMDGFECCQRLRQLPKASHVPILMITVLDKPEFVDRAFQSGASDYITKPISWAVLSHRVRALLERYHSTRQAEVTTTSLTRYQAWKTSQRQLRQNHQTKTAPHRLLETLQSLCQFVGGNRTLLYQFDSEQWLEATSQTSDPITSKLPHLPSDWITALQAQFPEPIIIESSPQSERQTGPQSGPEASFQVLQNSLGTTALWAYPVCLDGKVKAVLLVCRSERERNMLALEKESIQDTADYLGYNLPSLNP